MRNQRPEPPFRTIVFYISGHGFGHASRSIEVINELLARWPGLSIIVRTTAAKWLFERTIRLRTGTFQYHHVECDTGIVQVDSLHLDVDETVRRARAFMSTFEERVAAEAAFLTDQSANLVVADIPPLGIAAARRAGLPAVALGNFTWDWVYSSYQGTDDIVAAIGLAYAGANLALRLPMHGGFSTFATIEDVPFIARRSARAPSDTRHALGLPLDERLALVSFGGYGLEGLDLDALSRLHGYVALVSGSSGRSFGSIVRNDRSGRSFATIVRQGSLMPVDERAMYAAGFRYEDLVRAVDVVVTKPGYGIIAECLANDTALLYTSRGPFIEYDVLVAAMPRFLRAAYIDHADLLAGRWAPHLAALVAQPDPAERPATDGAEVAASVLLEMI